MNNHEGVCVLAPSLIGIGIRRAVGDARIATAKPYLKLINSAILLALNYSNASVSLPQAIAEPDADFLALTLAIVVACVPSLSLAVGSTPGCSGRPRCSGPH